MELTFGKKINECLIDTPNDNQYELVLQLAKKMELDLSDIDKNQFKAYIEEGEVKGFARLVKRGSIQELATLGVVRDRRNEGIGRQLIDALTNEKKVYITTVTPEFFEKLGFKKLENYPEELSNKMKNRKLWEGYGKPYVMLKK